MIYLIKSINIQIHWGLTLQESHVNHWGCPQKRAVATSPPGLGEAPEVRLGGGEDPQRHLGKGGIFHGEKLWETGQNR